MEIGLPGRLQEHILDELYNEAMYRELAEHAPNEEHKQLLLEFADDDRSHAEDFSKIYRDLVGYDFVPVIIPVVLKGSYEENLRRRILGESESFRKYDKEYLSTNNSALKNAYYKARTDDNVHTTRLLYLLSE